jgi:hypothetical protein
MSGITNPAEYYFKDGSWTFDGTVWRPQNQLLAYRDVVHESWTTSTASAGTNLHSFSAVADGYVHIYTALFALDTPTAASAISWYVHSAGSDYQLDYSALYTPTRILRTSGQIVLRAGDYLTVVFLSCALNDSLAAYTHGYKFLIAE